MRLITTFFVMVLVGACGGSDKPAVEEPAAAPTTESAPATAGEPAPATAGEPAPATAGEPAGATAEQTYAEAMQAMCDAPTDIAFSDLDGAQKATELDKKIRAVVTNQEALDMYLSFAGKGPAEKKAMVLDAASKAGIAECRFADVFIVPPSSATP